MSKRRMTAKFIAAAIIVVTVLASTACQAKVDTFVALGDSYTSGPGIDNQVAGPSTDPNGDLGSPSGCDRSDRNYPSQARTDLAADGITFARFWDFSCSGATTGDFYSGQSVAPGPNVPQLAAIGSATKVVTIGVGGNDIGFVSIAENCISLVDQPGTVCKQDYVHDGTDELRDRIDTLAPTIAQLITDVHRRGPQAQIYIVGYPTLLPASGWCSDAPIRDDDGTYLRGIETYLNQMLATQAQRNGAYFVDTETSSVGHDACAGAQAWVNGRSGTSGDGILAHPNAAGMAHTAQLVAAAIEAHNS